MAKHFALTITDDDVTFERKTAQINAEAGARAANWANAAHRRAIRARRPLLPLEVSNFVRP